MKEIAEPSNSGGIALPQRRLGRTGLSVFPIALGCSGYWGNKLFPEEQAERVVLRALERGVNLLDTGHNYSAYHAEPRLGRILERVFAARPRSGLVISSKAGTVSARAGIVGGHAAEVRDFTPDGIERSCLASLRNLKCGYLDIFQLHGIGEQQITEALLRRLEKMKASGMYNHLGINTHTPETMRFVARNPDLFDVALVDYNVLQLDREPEIDDLCRAGVGVMAGTVLAQGHLLKGKIGRMRKPADLWYLARALLKPSSRALMQASHGMKQTLASITEMSPAQAAFAYVLRNPSVSTCVQGTTRVANLDEIIDTDPAALTDTSCRRIADAVQAASVAAR